MKRVFIGIAVILTVLIIGVTPALAAPRGCGRGYGRGYGYRNGGYCYYNNRTSANAVTCPYGNCYVDNNNDGICDNYQNGTYNQCGRGWRYWAQ